MASTALPTVKLAILLTLFVSQYCLGNENQSDDEDLVVPKPVMRFIMQCEKSRRDEDLVPVVNKQINVEDGTTSQQVSLLGIDELHSSLKSAIESEPVADHIMEKIMEELSVGPQFRTETCPPTMTTLNISVPPQELQFFNLRMERVLQQNNNVLISQIGNLITEKFATMQRSLETLIKQKTRRIYQNLTVLSSRIEQMNQSKKKSNQSSNNDTSEDETKSAQSSNATPPRSQLLPGIVEAIQASFLNQQTNDSSGSSPATNNSTDESAPQKSSEVTSDASQSSIENETTDPPIIPEDTQAEDLPVEQRETIVPHNPDIVSHLSQMLMRRQNNNRKKGSVITRVVV